SQQLEQDVARIASTAERKDDVVTRLEAPLDRGSEERRILLDRLAPSEIGRRWRRRPRAPKLQAPGAPAHGRGRRQRLDRRERRVLAEEEPQAQEDRQGALVELGGCSLQEQSERR